MIISAVNQTELDVAGVVGLPVTIPCYGVSESSLTDLRLYFINETSGKDELQSYSYTKSYSKAADKTDFKVTVSSAMTEYLQLWGYVDLLVSRNRDFKESLY